jgi:hypothetical protein
MAGETLISIMENHGTEKQTITEIVTPGYLLLHFVGDKIQMKGTVKLEALKPLLMPMIIKMMGGS